MVGFLLVYPSRDRIQIVALLVPGVSATAKDLTLLKDLKHEKDDIQHKVEEVTMNFVSIVMMLSLY